jgi:hypothetical protein
MPPPKFSPDFNLAQERKWLVANQQSLIDAILDSVTAADIDPEALYKMRFTYEMFTPKLVESVADYAANPALWRMVLLGIVNPSVSGSAFAEEQLC